MDKAARKSEDRPVDPPRATKRTIFSLASVLLVSGIAMIIFRDREKDRDTTGANAPPSAFPRWSEEDLARDEVLVTSFEPTPSGLSVWGGGVRRKEFATDGDYSFLVVFQPDDVTSAGLLCRRGTLPDLSRHGKLLMDVRAKEAPFPVSLTLLAVDGEKQRRFTFPELTVPLEGSTLEFDLDSVPGSVPRSEINLLSLATSTRPRRKLSLYVDAIRLHRGARPVASRPTSRDPLVFDDHTNFIPDGQFDAGLALWSFRATPRRWTVSSTVDPDAPGGRVLGIHFLEADRLELASPELSLPPGRHEFRMTLKGWEGFRWDAELVMSDDGESWKSLRPGRDDPGTVTGQWQVVEREFVIPMENEEPVYQVRIVLEGQGDVHLDSVELRSLEGAAPPADYMSVYSPVVGADSDGIPTWRWDGKSETLRESTSGAVFPVFYLEDDFLLDSAAQRFRRRCRSLGLTAAVDLGGYLQLGDLALARERVQRRARDGSVGAWLLTPRANWSVAAVPPDLARQASEVLAGDDRRLTAIGLAAERKEEVDIFRLRSYEETADALVLAQGAGHGLSVDTQKAYDTALRAAAVLEPSTPYLAFVELGDSEKALRLQFHLALIHRAAGIVLIGGSDAAIETVPWESLERLRDETAALAAEIASGADAEITFGHPDLRLRAFTASGKRFLLAANPSPRDLRSVQVRVGGSPITISLGPWESKRISING